MYKRGQVSIFAIIGIVLVLLVAMFFFAKNQFGVFSNPTSFLSDKSKPIEMDLKKCVTDVTKKNLEMYSKQGGDFAPTNYKYYESRAVKYYCVSIPGKKTCMNIMPGFSELVSRLNKKIQDEVNTCVDKELLTNGFGYKVEVGNLTTKTTALGNGLSVKAHYDVTITKGEMKQKVHDVNVNFDAPLEEIYKVTLDIVNSEANVGFFEQLLYMLQKRGQYMINVDKPYPDKIYKIMKRGSSFEFWFAIEGERGI